MRVTLLLPVLGLVVLTWDRVFPCNTPVQFASPLDIVLYPTVRLVVRNVFQCRTACERDKTCLSISYDYKTRFCDLNSVSQQTTIPSLRIRHTLDTNCQGSTNQPVPHQILPKMAGVHVPVLDCGSPPGVLNGIPKYTTTTFSSFSSIECSPGFAFSGSSNISISCTADGSWDTILGTCNPVDCSSPPTLTNGDISFTTTTFNSEGQISCNAGYTFTGSATSVRCGEDGNWSAVGGSCNPVDCSNPPTLTNGDISFTTTIFNSEGQISCNAGYTFTGSATSVRCGEDGKWSAVGGACNPVDCSNPPTLTNGDISFTTTTFNSEGQISCNAGYTFSGSASSIRCGEDGDWDAVGGSCNLVDCGSPPTLVKGNIQATTTTFNSLGQIQCNTGYEFAGTQTSIQCGGDGNWSSVSGSCNILDCGVPTTVDYTDWVYSSTVYGATLQLTCVQDASFYGSSQTGACDANGIWSGINGLCRKDLQKIDGWILVLRATSDINKSVYDTWTNDSIYHDNPINDGNVLPGCLSFDTSLPCNMHFKSKLVTNWASHSVQEVKLVLLKNSKIRAEAVFNGVGTSNIDWFRQSKLTGSSWTDLLLPATTLLYFKIEGDRTRRFYIHKNYGSCPSDFGWMVVIDAASSIHPCVYDSPGIFPKLIYTPKDVATQYGSALADFEYGDAMAILVKL